MEEYIWVLRGLPRKGYKLIEMQLEHKPVTKEFTEVSTLIDHMKNAIGDRLREARIDFGFGMELEDANSHMPKYQRRVLVDLVGDHNESLGVISSDKVSTPAE